MYPHSLGRGFTDCTDKTSNYSYDNNGNVITDNKGNYVYDLKNNMISATRNNVTGNYYYNTLNQRVIKSVNGQTRYFVYNESNQLIGEYDSTGNIITEYVYFGLRPIAIKTNGNIYMVHTDYLGTPRYILDNASNMLWKWERQDPYGNNIAQGTIEFNLRFAGQYYDVESGLNYNINRMYDANTKRYMQSDPMGLIAGWNTYNYVGRNPLNFVDPLGLSYDSIRKDGKVHDYNCEKLKLLIERERTYSGKMYTYFNTEQGFPYFQYSGSEDLMQLNAPFDTIIGKVDGDYTLRVAGSMALNASQNQKMYDLTYGEIKYVWNGLNVIAGYARNVESFFKHKPSKEVGTLDMNLGDESHLNSAKAAYLYNNGLKLKDLFAPAIIKCEQMCK